MIDANTHPGQDVLTVLWPNLDALPPVGMDWDAWLDTNPPLTQHTEVTRDEFTRRMAGSYVLDLLHKAGRDTRVITLADTAALKQWLASS